MILRWSATVLALPLLFDQPAPRLLKLIREMTYGDHAIVQLGNPVAAALDAQGNLYVQDAGNRILVLDSSGRQLRQIGRPGRGPGEVMGISTWGWHRDTLWLGDEWLQRVTFLPPNGSAPIVRTYRRLVGGRDSLPIQPYAVLDDGTMIIEDPPLPVKTLAPPPDIIRYTRVSPEGTTVNPIATFAWNQGLRRGQPGLLIPTGEVGFAITRHPFPFFSLLRTSPDGNYITRIDRAVPVAGSPPTYVVTRLQPNGGVHWNTAVPYTPRMIPRGLIDSLATAGATSAGKVEDEFRKAYLARLGSLSTYPPVQEARVGADGTVFVKREAIGGNAQWDVLNSKGKLVGALSLPNASNILCGNATRIWVSETTPADEIFITRYRLSGS
jgi:hypothetical protein